MIYLEISGCDSLVNYEFDFVDCFLTVHTEVASFRESQLVDMLFEHLYVD